jgi:hypothetical protein
MKNKGDDLFSKENNPAPFSSIQTTTLVTQNSKLLSAVSVLKSRKTDAPWLLANSDFL